MKSIVQAVLVLLLISGCSGVEEPQVQGPDGEETQLDFTELSEFPSHGRTGAFSFTMANKIYVGTGFGANATYYGDFWEYDLMSNTWTEKSPFPLGPYMAGVTFVHQGKGYVLAGGTLSCPDFNVACDHIYYTTVHAYDPSSNTWEKVGELPSFQGMNFGSVEIVGDKAILFWDMKTYEINLLDFQYSQKSNPPASIAFSADFRVGNKVYFTCPMDSGRGTKFIYSYDLSTDQWETLPDFPGIKRYNAVGFSLDGYGYILGGKESDLANEDRQFKEIWQFNPNDISWKKVTDYPGAAYTDQVLETVGNDIYMGFGDTRSYIKFEKDWWKLEIK